MKCLLSKAGTTKTLPGFEVCSSGDAPYIEAEINTEHIRPSYPNQFGTGITGANAFALGLLVNLFM